jgi:flagellar FliJ protein
MIRLMKFRYSFQKVLDIKTNEKKQAESILSQAIEMMTSAEQELSELMLAKYRMQQQLVDEAASKRPMANLIAGQQYVDHLEERIQSVKRKLLAAEQRVNEVRQQLTDRTVDEKVWLKAREKAHASHRTEAERRAQYEMDEIATLRSRFAN